MDAIERIRTRKDRTTLELQKQRLQAGQRQQPGRSRYRTIVYSCEDLIKLLVYSLKLKLMQQAINETKREVTEPSSTGLRVVHSSRMTEEQKMVEGDVKTDQNAPSLTTPRYGTKTHYGRSYYPDGPAGNYQGL